MESIGKLLEKKKYKRLKESCEDQMIERGMIFTWYFGWITSNEAEWMNKKLFEYGFETNVEDMHATPAEYFYHEKLGEMKTRILPFVETFFEMIQARRLRVINLENG